MKCYLGRSTIWRTFPNLSKWIRPFLTPERVNWLDVAICKPLGKTSYMGLLNYRLLRVPYTPRPEEQAFVQRAEVQRDDELVVRVAVLDDRESGRFFGVPLAHRGIQPVWLQITNRGARPITCASPVWIRIIIRHWR